MSGRRKIKTSATNINHDNLIEVLDKALSIHELNRSEVDYLWNYYRGEQPIRNRVKEVRPEICNKIVENRANEIVSFKVGYLCGEPIQYVSRNGGEEIVKQINTLNEMMFAEDKAAQDQELVEWQMICGTAFRLVLPDEPDYEDEAPFEMFTLDPRDTFVVYSNEIGNKPIMAVKYSKDDNEFTHYSNPVIRNILKGSSWCYSPIRISYFWIINITAWFTFIFFHFHTSYTILCYAIFYIFNRESLL